MQVRNILFNSMLTQRKVPLVSLFLPTSKSFILDPDSCLILSENTAQGQVRKSELKGRKNSLSFKSCPTTAH